MNSRSLATRRVMKTIARRTPGHPLPVTSPDGSVPVVVSLPDDKLVDVARYVSKHFHGAANVFVPLRDYIALIDFSLEDKDPDVAINQVGHADTSMAMYIEFLKLTPGRPAKLTLDVAGVSQHGVEQIAYAF